MEKNETVESTPAELPPDEHRHEVQQMLKRARSGDESVVERLRAFLRCRGAADALGGNLAWSAMAQLVKSFAGSDLVVREALYRKLELLRLQMERDHENPSAAEELLMERVLSTWLHLHHLEMLYASQDRPTIESDSYFERAISSAQKRYLSVLRALIEARKLALPAVQVNVAREQVNLAGNVTAAPAA